MYVCVCTSVSDVIKQVYLFAVGTGGSIAVSAFRPHCQVVPKGYLKLCEQLEHYKMCLCSTSSTAKRPAKERQIILSGSNSFN